MRVMGVELPIEAPPEALATACARRLDIDPASIRHLRIARRSLDARRRGGRPLLKWVHHVDLELDAGVPPRAVAAAMARGYAREIPPAVGFVRDGVSAAARDRHVVVVGAGPSGLYAAWTLAVHGVRVTLIDRGPGLRERGRAVARFGRTRELDPERNLLFGEGGAGTYSDGKLYTRTQHAVEGPIVQTLIEAGAPPEIAFDARAHVGTDKLHRILPVLRARLEDMNVTFRFDTRLESLETREEGVVSALRTSAGPIACDGVVLALGHSARDTLRALHGQGLVLEAKPFQLGLRVEHPQPLIDSGRFGADADLALLGHAYYTLVCQAGKGASSVHSFCMCPGGQIVAAVAQPGLLCTNGMSNSRHSSPFANSGLVVTLGPAEYGDDLFAGVELQESLERRFFDAGGGDYTVPAQRVPDFLAGREGSTIGRTSYRLGVQPARIDQLLPEPVTKALQRGIRAFDRTLPGYAGEEGWLVGVESRSSGPLRIPRDPVTRLARGFSNLWPVGEGAGHAGGIMSAAIDGARAAWAVLGVPD